MSDDGINVRLRAYANYTRPREARIDCSGMTAEQINALIGKIRDMPVATDAERIERDRLLYGTGYGVMRDDGSLEHIPAERVIVTHWEGKS